jgi:radical SAM protein with 4Fe4S-binding SPASM domain
MDIIRQMGELGVPSVWLSGGEPLVRDDFFELVDALREQGINIARIYTNGVAVNDELLDGLDGRGVHPDFFLSFDGVGWHDWLRGVEGAEQMVIDRIRLLRARGFPVAAASAFHRNSIGSMVETMTLLAGLDVGYWVIEPMLNSGNWLGEDTSLNLSIPELGEAYLAFVERYYEAGSPINILIRRFFTCGKGSKNFRVPHEKHGEESDPCCLYARDHLYIAADGKLLPCIPFSGLRLQEDMPDLNSITIAQALLDSLYAELIETPVSALMEHNHLCVSCKRRKDCGCGCRATAIMFSSKDDYLGLDPAACVFFKGGWDDRIRSIADRYARLEPQGDSGERADEKQ